MKKKLVQFLCVCLLLVNLTGCMTAQPKIAYTIYPIEFLLQRIAGDKATLVSISDGTMVLRSQIAENYKEVLEDVDVLMHMGSVEPYMLVYSKEIAASKTPVIDLSANNSVYMFERYDYVVLNETTVGVSSKYYDSPIFDTIDTYTYDPYLWMDPIAMLSMAEQIRDWLINKYPEEAAYFNDNYDKLELELARLDADFHELKNNGTTIQFVSMTPSFGTWQKNYGIKVYPIVLSRYGVLPTDEQLELIKQRILADGVQYIIREPNLPDDYIELMNELAEELELTIVDLNNISSITDEQRLEGKDYIQLMRENLNELEKMESSGGHDTGETTDSDSDTKTDE